MNISFYRADINRIFKENNLYYDSYVSSTDGMIEITIEDGDWKHDHIRFKHIMRKNHYRHIKSVEIGTSEDDTYSATHYFKYGI